MKKLKAAARKTVKEAKGECWKKYVNSLNTHSKIKTIWEMMRKIAGKNHISPIVHLKKNNNKATSKKEIANLLAETFAENSKTNKNQNLQKYKQEDINNQLNFSSKNTEAYNNLFTQVELIEAIKQSHNTVVGPDQIHYEFIKQLPQESLKYLLNIFNNIWTTGKFPKIWRESIIIPILKEGNNPQSYQPIALANCLCRTMERMVNTRLSWFLEEGKHISKYQCGYNKKHNRPHNKTRNSHKRGQFKQTTSNSHILRHRKSI